MAQQQIRITTDEVIQRIEAELVLPASSRCPVVAGPTPSPWAARMAGLREQQQRFRKEPIGGRLLLLKRMVFWFVASAFDRQGKVVDELLDLVADLGSENQRLQEQLRELQGRELQGNAQLGD